MALLQSTEQAIELAEIAADARDYVAASRAENTTPRLPNRLGAVHCLVRRAQGAEGRSPLASTSLATGA